MAHGEWYLSGSGERFDVGGFSTEAEAIAAAPEELDLEPGDTFYVGQAVDPGTAVSARRFVDMLDDHASEEGPDGNDGYGITEAAKQDLDALLKAWAEKHNVKPTWYAVESVTSHVVPERQEAARE